MLFYLCVLLCFGVFYDLHLFLFPSRKGFQRYWCEIAKRSVLGNGPDRPPNPSKKVEGEALHLFGRVWRSIGPLSTPNIDDVRLRPEPWLQKAEPLVSVAVAY